MWFYVSDYVKWEENKKVLCEKKNEKQIHLEMKHFLGKCWMLTIGFRSNVASQHLNMLNMPWQKWKLAQWLAHFPWNGSLIQSWIPILNLIFDRVEAEDGERTKGREKKLIFHIIISIIIMNSCAKSASINHQQNWINIKYGHSLPISVPPTATNIKFQPPIAKSIKPIRSTPRSLYVSHIWYNTTFVTCFFFIGYMRVSGWTGQNMVEWPPHEWINGRRRKSQIAISSFNAYTN